VPSPILSVRDVIGTRVRIVLVLFAFFSNLPNRLVVVINAPEFALMDSDGLLILLYEG